MASKGPWWSARCLTPGCGWKTGATTKDSAKASATGHRLWHPSHKTTVSEVK